MTADLLHDDVASLLRVGEHRYTTSRRQVISVLHTSAGPVTILDILEVDTGLAQSSVYRNLAILEEVGAVVRIVTHDDHARFELAERLTDHHHHHLICTICGSVSDFELTADTEGALNMAFAKVSRSAKFTIDSHRLDLLGSCADCA
ncbi:MAG: Fe2+ or Zn2+ uptake regulation protein [Minisyncoccia bacterium]|jgi:Fe2+ or Zn2+ uptake regulation protein|uniref:Fur family transcriptional regulator n=1 Tax=uncultured Ilumatobacter sp. TaxID=879968 RepID=UPI00374E7609|tara:strand:+ start:2893 stop:3333 length:441 start_codon:yes stop_codon:yes gene_type:complete